jgi:serine/threonine protein kinase
MSTQPEIPGQIDHYRIVRRLALGGMAEIFLAEDTKSGRLVALKKILPHIANDPDFLDRFFHEIRIQISLKHPNVVELLDCSPSSANAYIVMEYVDGGELHGLRQMIGRFPWEIALHVVEEALRGLGAAHKKGIVHRDIKPQNIMWTTEGGVKIADFGISHAPHLTRLTMTGTVVGTPAHMSPEQARGQELDGRTDLFSMGTVLYELLCGYNPFASDTIAGTLQRVAEAEPEVPSLVDPSIPPAVDGFLRKLHAKDRRARFASADEASTAIEVLFEKEKVAPIDQTFRLFLKSPAEFVGARNTRLAAEAASTAQKLLADRSAPPEEALWAAYRTVAVAPNDPQAQALLKTAALRAGQREKPIDNAKIRELEEALKRDPDNLSLLLQLAKLYRLERDFINLMRFFRKLQSIAPSDPYTQGQIASLVPSGGAERSPWPATGSRTQAAPPPSGQPAPAGPGFSRRAVLTFAGAAILLGLVVFLARGPKTRERDPVRARASLTLLREATIAAPTPPLRTAKYEALQSALERGALIEKQSGADGAIAFYRDAAQKAVLPAHREVLLTTIYETAIKNGKSSAALAALDDLIAMGGAAALRGKMWKAEILQNARDDAGAGRLWGEVSRGDGPEAVTALLRLAMAADREHDAVRALSLYEDVLRRAPPSSDEANGARLGAAALYRTAGRMADARRMYEEVLDSARPGSGFDTSAEQGLRSLEGK